MQGRPTRQKGQRERKTRHENTQVADNYFAFVFIISHSFYSMNVQNLTRVESTRAARPDECAAQEPQGLMSVPSLGTLVNQGVCFGVENWAFDKSIKIV